MATVPEQKLAVYTRKRKRVCTEKNLHVDDAVEVSRFLEESSEPTVDGGCRAILPLDASFRSSSDGRAENGDLSSGKRLSTSTTLERSVIDNDGLNTNLCIESCMSTNDMLLDVDQNLNSDENVDNMITWYPNLDDKIVTKKSRHCRSRRLGSWTSAVFEKFSKNEFLDVIDEYIQRTKPFLAAELRKHLSDIGWRLLEKRDKGGRLRKQYTSPDGKSYDSLRQVCLDLRKPDMENISSAFRNNSKSTQISPAAAISPPVLQHPEEIEDPDDRIAWYPDDKIVTKKSRHCRSRRIGPWWSAGCEKFPENKFFDIIDEYMRASEGKKRAKPSLTAKLRRHLSSYGWRLCETRDKAGTARKQYISPDGKNYYSLCQVCRDIRQPARENVSAAFQNNSNSIKISPVAAISSPVLQNPEEIEDPDYTPVSALPTSLSVLDIEPEFCPQAVSDYVDMETKKERKGNWISLALKAKKHLVAIGWTLGYSQGGQKPALCYRSPRRSYYSLVRACRAILKEGNDDRVVSARRHMGSINITEVETLPFSGNLHCGTSNVRKLLLPRTRNCREISTGKSSTASREVVQEGIFKLQGNRKLRAKNKGNALLASHSPQSRAHSLIENRSVTRLLGKDKLRDQSDQCQKPHRSKRIKASGDKSKDFPDSIRPILALRSSKRARQMAVSTSSVHGPRTELSWLIDNSAVLPRARVYYRGPKDTSPMKEGRITHEGIMCKCCRKRFSLSGFQAHAGSKNRSPSACIYLEDGRSLLDCQRQIIDDIRSRDDALTGLQQGWDDSICSVCHYGGDLILCDQCPSAFHKSCLHLRDVPDGEWFCPPCCCGICGQSKIIEGTENFTEDSLVNCIQCENKYHVRCLQRSGGIKPNKYLVNGWFCGKMCKKIFQGLQKLLGRKMPAGVNNLTWTLLKAMTSESPDLDASEVKAMTENYSRLKVALDVMHECFEPFKEPCTGRDLIKDVIFSKRSDLKRLNFRGFYTAVLERNDDVVTVATVRVYGGKVAEIPLIATRFQYRRLGMCRKLMNELEKKLGDIGVERLILPAVPGMLNTWTRTFGFLKITESERLQYLHYTFLDFQDTIMCHKILLDKQNAKLIPSRETPPIYEADVNRTGDKVEFDGSSSVSEVLQAEQSHENGTVDQGLLDSPGSGTSGSGNCNNAGQVQLDVVVFTDVNETALEEGGTMIGRKNNTYIKYYYARRKKRYTEVPLPVCLGN